MFKRMLALKVVFFVLLGLACSKPNGNGNQEKLKSSKNAQREMAKASSTSFGQYFGTLTHDQLGMQQLAKLQLVSVRGEQNNLLLQAILTLHFGDIRSGEYVSYHYENLRYDPVSGKLTFDQQDQKLTITTAKFNGTEFVGDVRIDSSYVGKLEMSQTNSVTPTMPLIAPLWGEYQGTCDGKEKTLQLQTFRSTVDTHRTGDPFAAYQISGQLAEKDSALCPAINEFEPAPKCVMSPYFNGSYNFFRGALTLFGGPRNESCFVDKTSLVCGSCRLDRTSKELDNGSAPYSWPRMVNAFENETTSEEDNLSTIAGEYLGYVYHEYLEVYQPVKMSFVTFQDSGADDGSLRLSAVATSFFGDFESNERLNYRFAERPFPILTTEFVLDRPDADLDIRLKITNYGSGSIKGIWYSRLFGRVGEFYFTKDNAPDLPQGAKLISAIGGVYNSATYKLNLGVGSGQAPVNTENPFFPLVFNGYLWPLSGVTARVPLVSGSYDFYTGKIGFLLGDETQFVVGENRADGLYLKRTPRKMGLTLQSHELNKYVLEH